MDETEEITIESFNTPEMYAKEAQMVFYQNATAAAEKIVTLALHGSSERMQLDASKYIVDRTCGRIDVKSLQGQNGEKEPWDDLFGAVIREPTATERAQGKRPS